MNQPSTTDTEHSPHTPELALKLREFLIEVTGPWPLAGPHSLYRRGAGRKADRHIQASRTEARRVASLIAQHLLIPDRDPESPAELLYLPPAELIRLSLIADHLALSGERSEALADQAWRVLTAGHAWQTQTLTQRHEAYRTHRDNHTLHRHYAELISTEPRWPLIQEGLSSQEQWIELTSMNDVTHQQFSMAYRMNIPDESQLTTEKLRLNREGQIMHEHQVACLSPSQTWPQPDLNWWTDALKPLQRLNRRVHGTGLLIGRLDDPASALHASITEPACQAASKAQLARLRGQSSQDPESDASEAEQVLRFFATTRFNHAMKTGELTPEKKPTFLERLAQLDTETEPADQEMATVARLALGIINELQPHLHMRLPDSAAVELLTGGVQVSKMSVKVCPLSPSTLGLTRWIHGLIRQGYPHPQVTGDDLHELACIDPATIKGMSIQQASIVIERATDHQWSSELGSMIHSYLRRECFEVFQQTRETRANSTSLNNLMGHISPEPWNRLRYGGRFSLDIVTRTHDRLSQKQALILLEKDTEETPFLHYLRGVWSRPRTVKQLRRVALTLGVEASDSQILELVILGTMVLAANGGNHGVVSNFISRMERMREMTRIWTALGGSREAMTGTLAYLGFKKNNNVSSISDHITAYHYLPWMPPGIHSHLGRELYGIINEETQNDHERQETGEKLTTRDQILWRLASTPLQELP